MDPATGKLWLYPGTSTPATINARTSLADGGWNAMNKLTGGDYNTDGNDDLLAVETSTGKLWLYPGPNPGSSATRVQLGNSGWNAMNLLTGGDYNTDGNDDLVAVETSTGKLWLYPGPNPGNGATRVQLGSSGWTHMNKLTGGDYNGDGQEDILAIETSTGKLWLYPGPNPGNGATRIQVGNGGWNTMSHIVTGDHNGDGIDDLLAVEGATGRLWLYPGPNPGNINTRIQVRITD